VAVKVPAGIDTGDRIRLAGEGAPGEHGGPPGDLYVTLHVREHPIFTRQDNDLYCEVPIGFITAALGGELHVPSLEGKILLKIPAETQTGKVFRVRGKGVKSLRGRGEGDLLVRVTVETPVHLTSHQKDLLRQFGETLEGEGDRHVPKASNWLGGVKKFFEEMKF
jgi:molecular chaperone DnaJ